MVGPVPQQIEKREVVPYRKRKLPITFGVFAVMLMTPAALMIITKVVSTIHFVVPSSQPPSLVSDIFPFYVSVDVGAVVIVGLLLLYGLVVDTLRRKRNKPSDLEDNDAELPEFIEDKS